MHPRHAVSSNGAIKINLIQRIRSLPLFNKLLASATPAVPEIYFASADINILMQDQTQLIVHVRDRGDR